VDLTIGPALEEGFYYDCYMGDKTLTEGDKERIESRVEASIKENQKFERIVVSREEALAMFQENKFKVSADVSNIILGKHLELDLVRPNTVLRNYYLVVVCIM
jgi:threonyl-tRNA synthetase